MLTRINGGGLYYVNKAPINCLISTKLESSKWNKHLGHASTKINNEVLSLLGKENKLISGHHCVFCFIKKALVYLSLDEKIKQKEYYT